VGGRVPDQLLLEVVVVLVVVVVLIVVVIVVVVVVFTYLDPHHGMRAAGMGVEVGGKGLAIGSCCLIHLLELLQTLGKQ